MLREPLASGERPDLVVDASERAMEGVVVGRENHFGSKSQRGTEVAALFCSLLESAKLAGVDPAAHLAEGTRRPPPSAPGFAGRIRPCSCAHAYPAKARPAGAAGDEGAFDGGAAILASKSARQGLIQAPRSDPRVVRPRRDAASVGAAPEGAAKTDGSEAAQSRRCDRSRGLRGGSPHPPRCTARRGCSRSCFGSCVHAFEPRGTTRLPADRCRGKVPGGASARAGSARRERLLRRSGFPAAPRRRRAPSSQEWTDLRGARPRPPGADSARGPGRKSMRTSRRGSDPTPTRPPQVTGPDARPLEATNRLRLLCPHHGAQRVVHGLAGRTYARHLLDARHEDLVDHDIRPLHTHRLSIGYTSSHQKPGPAASAGRAPPDRSRRSTRAARRASAPQALRDRRGPPQRSTEPRVSDSIDEAASAANGTLRSDRAVDKLTVQADKGGYRRPA